MKTVVFVSFLAKSRWDQNDSRAKTFLVFLVKFKKLRLTAPLTVLLNSKVEHQLSETPFIRA